MGPEREHSGLLWKQGERLSPPRLGWHLGDIHRARTRSPEHSALTHWGGAGAGGQQVCTPLTLLTSPPTLPSSFGFQGPPTARRSPRLSAHLPGSARPGSALGLRKAPGLSPLPSPWRPAEGTVRIPGPLQLVGGLLPPTPPLGRPSPLPPLSSPQPPLPQECALGSHRWRGSGAQLVQPVSLQTPHRLLEASGGGGQGRLHPARRRAPHLRSGRRAQSPPAGPTRTGSAATGERGEGLQQEQGLPLPLVSAPRQSGPPSPRARPPGPASQKPGRALFFRAWWPLFHEWASANSQLSVSSFSRFCADKDSFLRGIHVAAVN